MLGGMLLLLPLHLIFVVLTVPDLVDGVQVVEFATRRDLAEFDWSKFDFSGYSSVNIRNIETGQCIKQIEIIKEIPVMEYIVSTVVKDELGERTVTHQLAVYPWLDCLSQEDPRVLQHLMEKHTVVKPTSRPEPPYRNLKEFSNFHGGEGFGIPDMILSLFEGILDTGYFMEAGAADGEYASNTLLLELHGWTGTLVEQYPVFFKSGLQKKRHSTWVTTCLSPVKGPKISKFGRPITDEFDSTHYSLGMHDGLNSTNEGTYQCFPLYSILLSQGKPTVHYLSLDIEGAEYDVLSTVPFDKVDIWSLSVETFSFPQRRHLIHELLDNAGYVYVGTIFMDDIFVKRWLLEGCLNDHSLANYRSVMTTRHRVDRCLIINKADPQENKSSTSSSKLGNNMVIKWKQCRVDTTGYTGYSPDSLVCRCRPWTFTVQLLHSFQDLTDFQLES